MAEEMLSVDELSALRRMVSDTARVHEFKHCRIVLSNGQVIADLDPSHITVRQGPGEWNSVAGFKPSSGAVESPDGTSFFFPGDIAGQGKGVLKLNPGPATQHWNYWEAQAGLGAIGAAGLMALLVTYRRM